MLTSTATNMLRTTAVRSPAGSLQPIIFRSAACPYSTTASLPPFSISQQSKPATKSQSLCTASRPLLNPLLVRFRIQSQQRRNASTSTRRTDAEIDASAAEAAAAAQAAAYPEQTPLDWNTFFKLRKTRRRWQLGFSVVSALGTGATASILLTTGAADALVAQVPLDPFIALGLMVFGFTGLGWLVGPSIGSAVFNVINKGTKGQMAVKESQFFARIKKHRVDPSTSSMGNPGEFFLFKKGFMFI